MHPPSLFCVVLSMELKALCILVEVLCWPSYPIQLNTFSLKFSEHKCNADILFPRSQSPRPSLKPQEQILPIPTYILAFWSSQQPLE